MESVCKGKATHSEVPEIEKKRKRGMGRRKERTKETNLQKAGCHSATKKDGIYHTRMRMLERSVKQNRFNPKETDHDWLTNIPTRKAEGKKEKRWKQS